MLVDFETNDNPEIGYPSNELRDVKSDLLVIQKSRDFSVNASDSHHQEDKVKPDAMLE